MQAIIACLPNATIAFVNDANAAALAKRVAGVPSFVPIALGTGVGAGVVVDGKLLRALLARRRDWSHIVEPEEMLTCGQGRHGV